LVLRNRRWRHSWNRSDFRRTTS